MNRTKLLSQIDLTGLIGKYAKKIPVENETGNMRGACFIFTSTDLWKMVDDIALQIIDIEARERKAVWSNV